MLNLYRYFNLLSIDVALGVFFSSWMISDALGASVNLHQHVVVALSVWLVYTFDQLADVYTLHEPLLLKRRIFHQTYFNYIVPAFLIVLLLTGLYAWLVLTFTTILYGGLCLFILVCYFIMNFFTRAIQTQFYSKEFIIAIGYACGVCSLAFANLTNNFAWSHLWMIVCVAGFAFVNLCIIARFEATFDYRQKTTSIALWMQSTTLQLCMGIALSTGLIAGIVASMFAPNFPWALTVFLAITPLVFLTILSFPRFFAKDERYRLLADAVFLIPGIPLILQNLVFAK